MSASSERPTTLAGTLALLNDSALSAIIEAMVDGVFIYHADGRLRMTNSAGLRLLALDRRPDFADLPTAERIALVSLLDAQGRPIAADDWPVRRILHGEQVQATSAVAVRMRAFDGRMVDGGVTGAPLRGADGAVIGAVAILRDVTAHRRLERRSRATLNALLEMAEALVALPNTAPIATPTDDESDIADDDALAGADTTPPATSELGIATDDDAPDANATATRVARLIRGVLGLERVGVLLAQPGGDALAPAAVAGLAPAQQARWRERLVNVRLSDLLPSAALIQRFQEDEPLGLDLRQPHLRPLAELLAPFDAHQVVIAPMRIGAQLIGLILLDPTEQITEDPGEQAGADENTDEETSEFSDALVGVATNGLSAISAPLFVIPEEGLALVSAVAKLATLVFERERLIHERAEERAHRIALSAANQRMDEFLAIASHELRSPLTAIKANVQLAHRRIQRMPANLPQSSADATQATVCADDVGAMSPASPAAYVDGRAMAIELLERTEQQITRLNRLVDDLLDISRIQAGKLELLLAPCDLAQLAQEVVEEQRQSQPQRVITFTAEPHPTMLLADADRVRQVITNYVTNALKYSPADRPVAVQVSATERRARLTVRDQGPGLPTDEQARIWERFHRAPGVEQVGGTGVGLGLGLHISRTFIERLGGHVGVESTVGEGSSFWFTLPLATR